MVKAEKWHINLDRTLITDEESVMIEELLRRLGKSEPQVEDIWRLMDEVWDELQCDSTRPVPEKLKRFYSHPVWLLNGIFVEQDPVSIGHRTAIKDWIENRKDQIQRVLDFGGGTGTLGVLIAGIGDDISVEIFEPFPTRMAESRASRINNVKLVSKHIGSYDCLLSIDVLEHVTEPLKILDEMAGALRSGGYMIVANNFFPVIKCHLPSTFYLRFSFRLFARLMGLRREGPCPGSHATVYVRTGQRAGWFWISVAEKVTRLLYYPLHVPYFFYRLVRFSSVQ